MSITLPLCRACYTAGKAECPDCLHSLEINGTSDRWTWADWDWDFTPDSGHGYTPLNWAQWHRKP